MMSLTQHAAYIFTIDNFITLQECRNFIERSEAIGYNEATIVTEKGVTLMKNVRDNSRVIFMDEALAAKLWVKVKPFMGDLGHSTAIGLNEMFRFYKYEPGQSFKTHRDQSFIRNDVEASYYTLLIYLNDDFVGGDTIFDGIVIKPELGTALVFLHDLEHSGSTVDSGVKYVLRTDIMYKLLHVNGIG